MNKDTIRFDCISFKGHIPCEPNKKRGKVCATCDEYTPVEKRILIIKLGAIGDVIRTTPLLHALRKKYPHAHITWLTYSPDVLPREHINELCTFNTVDILNITHTPYDIAINLDKDKEACTLMASVEATEKYGFTWHDGHIDTATDNAIPKLITGLFDQISQENTKNYLEEIFEICHLPFKKEPYTIRLNKSLAAKWQETIEKKAKGKPVVGLNTGCGARWKTRLWTDENWVMLIKKLQQGGYFPVLLGGPDEDDKNKYYATTSGAWYPGHFSLEEFIALSNSCDIVVTQVSMMMHIAIALKKYLVLMNNIFNRHEFELYDNGIIIEPPTGCDCYYGGTCSRDMRCMHDITPDMIENAIREKK